MSYNIAKHAVGWHFCVLQDGEDMGYLSQTILRVVHQRDIHTHIYTHEPTTAIGENAKRCILPKNV